MNQVADKFVPAKRCLRNFKPPGQDGSDKISETQISKSVMHKDIKKDDDPQDYQGGTTDPTPDGDHSEKLVRHIKFVLPDVGSPASTAPLNQRGTSGTAIPLVYGSLLHQS
jgi:hypothetical protein